MFINYYYILISVLILRGEVSLAYNPDCQ